jgi:hypothetical protein
MQYTIDLNRILECASCIYLLTIAAVSGSTSDLRIRGKFFAKTKSLANRDGDTESQGSGEG